MRKTFPHRRTPAAVAVLAVAVAGLVATSTAPAQAHSYLVESTPTADSVVTELPDAFSVTMNEQLLDLTGAGDGFALQVVDSSGAYFGDGCLTVSGATLSTGVTLGAPGDYTLIWQVVSEDGHPVSGELMFTWQPTDAAQISAGSVAPPVCGASVPTPTASASASATASATPEPTATALPIALEEQADADLSAVFLVGGVIAAVLVAAALVALWFRRRAKERA